jgi:hypothetical protein
MRSKLPLVLTTWFTVLALALAGCGGGGGGGGGIRRGTLDATGKQKQQAAVAAGDAAYAKRADRAQLEASIRSYEEALGLDETDYQTAEKLSHALYLLADGHLYFEREQKEAEFLATYEKGFAVALRGMAALSPQLEQRLAAGVDLKDAVALLDVKGVGLMYWYATNLGKWGNAQDITVVLQYKERILALMTRVFELDPTYFYGAPYRYFGAYYAIAPSFAGGDLDKSWKYFQDGIKHEPRYLALYTLIAENYAPKKQDAAMFDQMIQKVLDAALDVLPGLEAETAIEKRKAEQLKQRKESGEIPF